MKRWEFDSIAQAASSMLSWFRGTLAERQILKNYLNTSIGICALCELFLFHLKESALCAWL